MSNLGEVVAAPNDANATASGTLGAYLGLAADVSGVISLVQLVEDWISTDNSVSDSLNKITIGLQNLGQLLSQLEGTIAGNDKLQRMRDIDQGILPALAVAAQLPALLASHSPPPQDVIDDRILTCVQAVQFFSDQDDKWEVVRSDFPYPLDMFTGWFEPPPNTASPGDLVFNPLYTLPQFLRAIDILVTTIRALAPASLHLYAGVFTSAIERLEWVHQTIVDTGIMGTRLPDRSDFATIVTSDDGREAQIIGGPEWIGDVGYYPYGGVDIYTGANTVASYYPYLPYVFADMNSVGPDDYQNFQKLLSLRIEAQKKALYVNMGMVSVRDAVNTLRQLIGQPPSSIPLYSVWTYAEVISILGLTLPPLTHPRHNLGSAWPIEPEGMEDALRSLLLTIPPYTRTSVLQQVGIDVGGVEEPPIPLPAGNLYDFLTGQGGPVVWGSAYTRP
jgi:hypothetical protein